MPPTLMLLACCLFAIWALKRDAKKHPYRSSNLLLPTLWIMRCGSRGIDYWLGSEDNGRLDPLVIAAMIVWGLIILSQRRARWGEIASHNFLLFLFYGYLIVSVLWADSLESPAIKILRPLGDLIVALVVATEADPRQAIITIFRRCALLLIPLSIVLIRYYPDLGKLPAKNWGKDMWIGVTTHKNPLGQLCVVSMLACFWTLLGSAQGFRKPFRRPVRWLRASWKAEPVTWLLLLMTLNLLNGGGDPSSRSSTAFLCIIVAMALFFMFGAMRRQASQIGRKLLIVAISVGALSLVLNMMGTSLQAVVSGMQGKDATLSDRTYLWSDVIRIGMEHPVLGAGYGGFWVPSIYPKLSPEVNNHPRQSHNGYLETFANLGFVGVGLLAGLIFQSLAGACRMLRQDFEYGRIRLVLLFTAMLMNYSEATFPRGTHLWWFCFLIAALYRKPVLHTSRSQPVQRREKAESRWETEPVAV